MQSIWHTDKMFGISSFSEKNCIQNKKRCYLISKSQKIVQIPKKRYNYRTYFSSNSSFQLLMSSIYVCEFNINIQERTLQFQHLLPFPFKHRNGFHGTSGVSFENNILCFCCEKKRIL